MAKYYVYHCTIAEIDSETEEVTTLFEAASDCVTRNSSKASAARELRDILDLHTEHPMTAELARLQSLLK